MPKAVAILTHVTSFALALTVLLGVLTTGAGPHSGDPAVTLRNGFDATLLRARALLARLRPVRADARRAGRGASSAGSAAIRGWAIALLAVELVQIGVGLYQARNALPPLAVGVHMVLAAILAAICTALVLNLKRPVAARRRTPPPERRRATMASGRRRRRCLHPSGRSDIWGS